VNLGDGRADQAHAGGFVQRATLHRDLSVPRAVRVVRGLIVLIVVKLTARGALTRQRRLRLRLLHGGPHRSQRLTRGDHITLILEKANDLSWIGRADVDQIDRTHSPDHRQRNLDGPRAHILRLDLRRTRCDPQNCQQKRCAGRSQPKPASRWRLKHRHEASSGRSQDPGQAAQSADARRLLRGI